MLRITCSFPGSPSSRSTVGATLCSVIPVFCITPFSWSQQTSAQEIGLAVEHPLFNSGLVFAADPHALLFDGQQEASDTQGLNEDREVEFRFLKVDGRCGAQQDSCPSASSMRQIQPSASSLD